MTRRDVGSVWVGVLWVALAGLLGFSGGRWLLPEAVPAGREVSESRWRARLAESLSVGTDDPVRMAALRALEVDASDGMRVAALQQLGPRVRPEDRALLLSMAELGSSDLSRVALDALARLEDVDSLLEASHGARAASARKALGRVGDPRGLAHLLELAEGQDSAGIDLGLSRNGSPEAVEALVDRLDGAFAHRAAEALGTLAADVPEAREALIEAAGSPSDTKARSALWALARSGDPEVPALAVRALREGRDLGWALRYLEASELVLLYDALPDDPDVLSRLLSSPGDAITTRIIGVLEDGDPQRVSSLMRGLYRLPEGTRVQALLAAAQEGSGTGFVVRQALFRLLDESPPAEVLELARARIEPVGMEAAAVSLLVRWGTRADHARVFGNLPQASLTTRLRVIDEVDRRAGHRWLSPGEWGLLQALVADPVHQVATRAATVLVPEAIDTATGEALLALYAQSADLALAEVVARWSDARALDSLLERARENHGAGSNAAAVALARSSTDGHREALIAVFAELPVGVRGSAAEALLEKPDPEVLQRVLDDPEPRVRARGLRAMASDPRASVRERIADHAEDPDLIAVVIELGPTIPGPRGVEVVTAALDDPGHADEALNALVAMPEPSARARVEAEARSGPLRAQALAALAKQGVPGDLPLFRSGLESGDLVVETAAVAGLAAVGGSEASQLLVEQLDGPLAPEAARALLRLGGPVLSENEERIRAAAFGLEVRP